MQWSKEGYFDDFHALVYIQHIFLIYSWTLFDFIPASGAYDWGKSVPQFND